MMKIDRCPDCGRKPHNCICNKPSEMSVAEASVRCKRCHRVVVRCECKEGPLRPMKKIQIADLLRRIEALERQIAVAPPPPRQ